MKKKWAVRWALLAALIVAIWCDVRWALYLTVTMLMLAAEAEQIIEELKAEAKRDLEELVNMVRPKS